MLKLRPLIVFIVLFMFASLSLAASQAISIGDIANNTTDFISGISSVFNQACFIIGGSFIFASIIKYFEHRKSPLMVTWSTIIFLFAAGVMLIILPFASYFAGNALPH